LLPRQARAKEIMLAKITSRQNPIVARYRAIARGDPPDLVFLDGVHLVRDALAAGIRLVQAIVESRGLDRPEITEIVELLTHGGVDVVEASAAVMDAVSPVRSASPIVAIGARPDAGLERMYAVPSPLVVIAADVQDPGNLGAIVRVAEAGAASGVIAAGSSASPFGWKALRGSMGSALRLPVGIDADPHHAGAEARRHGCRVVATVARGGRPHVDVDLRGPVAILVGSEGAGLAPELAGSADLRVTIPMQAPVESLNAAVAAALLVYEARRQREP
jgi:TrmH family RNA methyltransferase